MNYLYLVFTEIIRINTSILVGYALICAPEFITNCPHAPDGFLNH